MKKAILSIGLFTLVLVSTSFASPKTSTPSIAENPVITSIDGNGGQSNGNSRKLDYTSNNFTINKANQKTNIDGNGGQSNGNSRKLD